MLAGGILACSLFNTNSALAELNWSGSSSTASVRASLLNDHEPFSNLEMKCGAKHDTSATKSKEGKCGEGKCGEKKAKAKDSKCGSHKKGKTKDSKCGADKKPASGK